MATVYSGEVAVGTYNRIRIKCDYSGTSATLTVQFSRTSTWTDTWADSAATLNFDGQNKPAAYNYYGTVGSSWVDLVSVGGYTISTSGGTYSWTFNNPGGGSVLGCSGTITIPSQSSPPTGLSVSAPYNIGPHGATFDVSISSYGVPSSASGRWIEAGITDNSTWSGVSLRSAKVDNVLSATIPVDNTSTQCQTLTVQPNTQYNYGGYATNSQLTTRQIFGQFVTTAEAATVSVISYTYNSATVSYSTTADGGYYDKTIKYSTDSGTTWHDLATITGSSAQSGTATLTGLLPNTQNSIDIAIFTTAGSTYCTTLSVTTPAFEPCKMLGSVNSQSKYIGPMYGSVNNQSAIILKIYGSDNGLTKRVY